MALEYTIKKTWKDWNRIELIVRFTKYCSGDQIKKGGIGGACSTDGRDEKCMQYFGWKTWKEETIWET
jgi:hypothetical protein